MAGTIRPEDIEAVVKEFQESRCRELHIKFDGFELHLTDEANFVTVAETPVRSSSQAQPEPTAAPPTASPSLAVDLPEGLELVRAPYQGIFYRAPKPGLPPYVEVGAQVAPDSEICLIEVMKLFTAVRAGVAGTVIRILAADGLMVEEGQPLLAIEPRG